MIITKNFVISSCWKETDIFKGWICFVAESKKGKKKKKKGKDLDELKSAVENAEDLRVRLQSKIELLRGKQCNGVYQHNAKIMSLWCQNNVATLFWHRNDIINCVVCLLCWSGLGSNTFYQIQIQIQIHFFPEFQIQIQIQIHRQKSDQIQIQIQIQLIKYKYKYTMRPRQNCGHFTDEILKYIVL